VNEHGAAADIFGDLPHVDAAQARLCARVLLRRPLVRSGGPDGELLPVMYRHRHVLQRLFAAYLGYQLRVERRFARLHKMPDAGTGRGISEFSSRSYVYLTLTLAALVETGRQLLLSQLVSDIRGAAAEAGISVSDERVELRELSLALRHLVDLGVLEETEGTVASVAHEHSAEALITVDMELLGLMAARLRFIDPRSQGITSPQGATVAQDAGIQSHRRCGTRRQNSMKNSAPARPAPNFHHLSHTTARLTVPAGEFQGGRPSPARASLHSPAAGSSYREAGSDGGPPNCRWRPVRSPGVTAVHGGGARSRRYARSPQSSRPSA
jgi:hypothetical protein